MNKDKLYFSGEEQAKHLLQGDWVSFVQRRFPEAWDAALTLQYLTITRGELAKYAIKNPDLTGRYFERVKATDYSNLHDVCVIWHLDGVYKVALIDHGSPRGVSTYASLAEAVADHIATVCGLKP